MMGFKVGSPWWGSSGKGMGCELEVFPWRQSRHPLRAPDEVSEGMRGFVVGSSSKDKVIVFSVTRMGSPSLGTRQSGLL